MSEDDQVDQDEIEKLLQQAQQGGLKGKSEPTPKQEEEGSLDQNDIEALFSSGAKAPAAKQPAEQQAKQPAEQQAKQGAPTATAHKQASPPSSASTQETSDIEYLLNQAEAALASLDNPTENAPPGIMSFQLRDFGGTPPNADKTTIDLIRDVELEVKIELGRTSMYLEEVLRMKKGSVVTLDKLAGDPVDIYVNERLVARGEVLILNDNFCVRVAELIVGDAVA
ncbi:MAG: flagellar motor switch protein FliN [Pirellulaceae bacterium]